MRAATCNSCDEACSELFQQARLGEAVGGCVGARGGTMPALALDVAAPYKQLAWWRRGGWKVNDVSGYAEL